MNARSTRDDDLLRGISRELFFFVSSKKNLNELYITSHNLIICDVGWNFSITNLRWCWLLRMNGVMATADDDEAENEMWNVKCLIPKKNTKGEWSLGIFFYTFVGRPVGRLVVSFSNSKSNSNLDWWSSNYWPTTRTMIDYEATLPCIVYSDSHRKI